MSNSYAGRPLRRRPRDNGGESRAQTTQNGRYGQLSEWGDGGEAVPWRAVNARIERLDARVESGFDNINDTIQDLALRVQNIPTRAEIDAADSRRVSLDTYTSDMRSINERLTRQETGWARLLPWISLLVSVTGSILIPLLLAVIYGIVYLAQHP